MDKICSIVLPNQLFKESLFHKKHFKIFMVEEHLFFNQYKFHKQKISFHRATMKFYYDYLNKFGCDIEYVESFSKESNIQVLVEKINFLGYEIIEIYDPVDYLIGKRLKKTCNELNIKLIIHETKLFINTSEELKGFFKESKKKFLILSRICGIDKLFFFSRLLTLTHFILILYLINCSILQLKIIILFSLLTDNERTISILFC